jgi:hypothetical protein
MVVIVLECDVVLTVRVVVVEAGVVLDGTPLSRSKELT